jgi:hypothetical protein
MSLTVNQITNFHGFPKAAELIEITGTQALEASDRAIYNHMLQIAHDRVSLQNPTQNGRSPLPLCAGKAPGTKAMTGFAPA